MTRGRAWLDRMLALAARYDLAVVLHAPHGAAVGALEALGRHGIERAVFHWHKAPAEVTRAIVDAGYFVSVTPEVVYRERDRDLVERVPLESLLVESDAPWAVRRRVHRAAVRALAGGARGGRGGQDQAAPDRRSHVPALRQRLPPLRSRLALI